MKTITHVGTIAATEAGHAIEVGLKIDGKAETLRCETHNVPVLVRALMEAAAIAEAQRKLQPGQVAELEMPYRAKELLVAPAQDGSAVAMKFLTDLGYPLVVAMAPNLARKASAHLASAADALGRQPPDRKH